MPVTNSHLISMPLTREHPHPLTPSPRLTRPLAHTQHMKRSLSFKPGVAAPPLGRGGSHKGWHGHKVAPSDAAASEKRTSQP